MRLLSFIASMGPSSRSMTMSVVNMNIRAKMIPGTMSRMKPTAMASPTRMVAARNAK